MSADFTPEKEDYKLLPPFKMQVLTNFPYIEADFDALTNYQLLCKVVEYLNAVIHNENEVTEQVTGLYNAYIALQNYVNTYFDNLDLTGEVSSKLDEMAEDGTLTNLIKGYVDPKFDAIEAILENKMEEQDEKLLQQDNEINNFKTIINSEIETIDNKVDSATSGSPKGVYETVSALTTADPDHDYIYVVTEDGKWYFYDTGTTSWVAGGTYQAYENSDTVEELVDKVDNLELINNELVKEVFSIDKRPTYIIINSWEENPSPNFVGFGSCVKANCILNKVEAMYKCATDGTATCDILDTSLNLLSSKTLNVETGTNNLTFDFGYLDLREYTNVWIRFYSTDGATPIRANLYPNTGAPNIASITNPYCYLQGSTWNQYNNSSMQVPFDYYVINENNDINNEILKINTIDNAILNNSYNITKKQTYTSIYSYSDIPSYNFTGRGACIKAKCIITKVQAYYKTNRDGTAICEIVDTSLNKIAEQKATVLKNVINDITFDFGYLDLSEYTNVWIRFYSPDGATPCDANLIPQSGNQYIADIQNPYTNYSQASNVWIYSNTASTTIPFSFYSIDSNNVGKVFYCGSTREYTTLKSAIEEATKYMDSILYVDAGTYDLITEFGSDYFANLTSVTNLEGLLLKNRIHIIFSANSKVVCNYTGSNEVVNESFSPFNAGEYGFTLENLTLECSNVRYCVHDERAGAIEQCLSRYINCNMYIDNHANSVWHARQCIGGGLGSNHTVDIKNCIFLTDYQGQDAVYYHQSGNLLNPNHRATINIYNCYFKSGTITLSFGRTDATENSIVEITNCSMKKYSTADTDGIIKLGNGTHREYYIWNNQIRN